LFLRYFKATDNDRRILLTLTLINLLAIYSHYYGWLVVGVEFLYLLIWRRKIVPFGISMIILLLLFAPWAYFVVKEATSIGGLERNLGWIPKPDLIDILNYLDTLIGPLGTRYVKIIGLAIFNLPLVLWIWRTLRAGWTLDNEDLLPLTWLSALAFIPVILIFIISQKYEQAVFMDRYFIFAAIPYMMLVSIAAARLPHKWVCTIWMLVMVAWTVSAGISDIHTNRIAWTSPQIGSRLTWDEMTRQLSEAEASVDGKVKVYTLPAISHGYVTGNWAISTSLEYFLDSLHDDRFEMIYAPDAKTVLKKAEDDHFWVAYFDIHEWPQHSVPEGLEENGYRVGEPIVYDDLGNRVILLPVWRK
jgi:hypothetical protein